MQAIGSRPKVHVTADGSGVVGHAGARLLADLADATGLTSAYATVLRPLRPRGTGHDPGQIATDLAVMIADGGGTITDLALLRDQAEVFGPVASTATASSATTRCCASSPTPAEPWPDDYVPETPERTPRAITSPSSTTHSPSSPTPTGTAPTC